ncbi:MAG: hypothetical protein PHN56_01435 [Candidatus Nanoarchaeia archaeon]|nr:hypothetical protein [Candidatus Nanoarchaeia archaeon]
MLCPNCNIVMIKGRYEYYCYHCGHVIDDYIYYGGNVKATKESLYNAWRCNFRQTMSEAKIINGRAILNNRMACPVRCR